MERGAMRFIEGTVAWAAAASIGLAQAQPDPAADPALNDPRVGERAKDLERRPPAGALTPTPQPGTVQRREPAVGNAPGVQAIAPKAPPPRTPAVRKEGTFLLRQRGSPVRLPSGEWLFVFHRDNQGRAERSMVLTPCRSLERLEQAAGPDPGAQTFVVTGQVFTYRGTNHLLLTAPPLLDRPEPSPRSEGPGPEVIGPEAGRPEGPALDDAIRALEAHRNRPRGLGVAAESHVPPGATRLRPATLPEGTMLVRRRARLARVSGPTGGETALILDSDADSGATVDPPMILVRCATLERMEWHALAQGETLVFEVSGRVLAHGGQNYLIPMLYRFYPPTELERRQ